MTEPFHTPEQAAMDALPKCLESNERLREVLRKIAFTLHSANAMKNEARKVLNE